METIYEWARDGACTATAAAGNPIPTGREDEEAKYCEREARRQNQRLILVRTEATDNDLESL